MMTQSIRSLKRIFMQKLGLKAKDEEFNSIGAFELGTEITEEIA